MNGETCVTRRQSMRLFGILLMGPLFAACNSTVIAPARSDQATRTVINGQVSHNGTAKIGALIPLSGIFAATGASMKAAIDLAVESINANGGLRSLAGTKVEVVYGDTQGQPATGVSETKRLVQQADVAAIIGAWNSAVTLPTSQIAEQSQTPYLNPVSSAPTITTRGLRYTFMLTANSDIDARDMVDYLQYWSQVLGKQLSRVAFIYENTDYGQTASAAGKKYCSEKGWQVVADVSYSAASPDLTTEVSRIKAAAPDFIFQASYLNDGVLIARAMDKLGVPQQIIDSGGTNDPKFVANLGPMAEGWTVLDQWNKHLGIAGSLELNDRYRAKTGFDLGGNAAQFYQGMLVLRLAVEKAGKLERDAIRSALANIDVVPGPDLILPYDRIKFDSTGLNTYASNLVVEIHGGDHIIVSPPKFAMRKPSPRKP